MKSDETEKIIIQLPHRLYHRLRDQAYQHNLSLPDFVRERIELRSTEDSQTKNMESLSTLSVKEILAKTKPTHWHVDERLDFFHG